MTGDATKHRRVAVMHLAVHHALAPAAVGLCRPGTEALGHHGPLHLVVRLGGRDASQPGARRQVAHGKRPGGGGAGQRAGDEHMEQHRQ